MNKQPAYTVALCTHNHADRLVRTLADLPLIHMPEAAWELLIIDNGSRDSTPEVLASQIWASSAACAGPLPDRISLLFGVSLYEKKYINHK